MYEGHTLVSVSSLHRLLRQFRVMQILVVAQTMIILTLLIRSFR